MSYRRLPNTDSARLKALQKAYEKGLELSPIDLAYSQKTFNKLRLFLSNFEKAYIDYQSAYTVQVENNKANYLPKLNKAKIYILHFFKVLKMSIERGDLPKNSLDFFELKANKMPVLTSEDKIFFWGNKIIEGESKRMSLGLKPVTNPTFGIVRVYFDNFVQEYRTQKKLKDNSAYFLNILASMRAEVNDIIKNIWDETELHFGNLEKSEKEANLLSYGVIFYTKKTEKPQKIKEQKKSDKILIDYSLPFSFL